MHHLNEPKPSRFRSWFKQSLLIKILSIGFITMLLMIPNSLVQDLIRERNYNQQEVVREVSNKWGKAQDIVGPVLTIPYKTYFENKDGEIKTYTKHSHFLPEFLNINGTVNPESRKRGLYNVVLYQTNIHCDGWFEQPDFKSFNIDDQDILWDQAFLQVSIPDMSGINDNIILNYGDDTFKMESGIEKINGFQSGVKIPIAIDREKKELEFRFGLDLNGSHSLQFGPIGKETNVKISSSWNSPSFLGAFLPDEHTINEDGFTASWKILDLNRNYPQAWVNEEQNLLQSTFGLKLMQPVDEYAKNTRSAKYALLVIALTFLIFFFFEIINKQKMHPMHYIFVGLAISIFYILLLSLSEHIGFNLAYIFSAWAVVGLIGIYTTSIIKSRYLVVMLSGILASIFGFIFIILQLEDFALLAGSIGLFMVLAIVMFYSRNIDWNKVGRNEVKVQPEME